MATVELEKLWALELTCRLLDCKARLHWWGYIVSLHHRPQLPPAPCPLCTSHCQLPELMKAPEPFSKDSKPQDYVDQNVLPSQQLLLHHRTCCQKEGWGISIRLGDLHRFVLTKYQLGLQTELYSQSTWGNPATLHWHGDKNDIYCTVSLRTNWCVRGDNVVANRPPKRHVDLSLYT